VSPDAGSLHHVELWVPDLGRAVQEWGCLPGRGSLRLITKIVTQAKESA